MKKLYGSNDAIDKLTEYGMSENDALFALDFAEDSGEYESRHFSVICTGRNSFEIEEW